MELRIERKHSSSCSPRAHIFTDDDICANGLALPPNSKTLEDTGAVKRVEIEGHIYYLHSSSTRGFNCNCGYAYVRLDSNFTHGLLSGKHSAARIERVARKLAKPPKLPPSEDEIDKNALEKDKQTGEILAVHWDKKRWGRIGKHLYAAAKKRGSSLCLPPIRPTSIESAFATTTSIQKVAARAKFAKATRPKNRNYIHFFGSVM